MGYDSYSICFGLRELIEMNLDEFVGGQALIAPFSLNDHQPLKRTYIRGRIESLSVNHRTVSISFSWIARSNGGTYEFDPALREEQHFVVQDHKEDSNGNLILIDETLEEVKLLLPGDEGNIEIENVRVGAGFTND